MSEVRNAIVKALAWRWLFSAIGTLLLAFAIFLAPWQEVALVVAGVNGILALVFGVSIAFVYLTEED